MKSIEGAVLFVDMLGFSALTRGQLPLTDKEFEPWHVRSSGAFPHQLLATKLLLAFRSVLSSTNHEFPNIRLAQLSDCVFLWSSDVGAVVDAARYLMNSSSERGLLCRGGIAFGNFHVPDKENTSMGAFVVGDAVTRAATHEAAGKGMRVFTDSDTVAKILDSRPHERFREIVNPLTGHVVDEWQWYEPLRPTKKTETLSAIERLVGIHTMLRYSPKYAWSATTPEGRRQLACSIASVSESLASMSNSPEDYKFSVEFLLAAEHERSDKMYARVRRDLTDSLLQERRPR